MEASDFLIVIAGAALVVSGISMIIRRFIFLKGCCTAWVYGSIIDMERTEKQRYTDSSRTVSYYLKYHYVVNGAEYSNRRRVGKRQLKLKGNTNYITVFFDPNKPKRHYVYELKFRMMITLLLIALGGLLLYYPFYY